MHPAPSIGLTDAKQHHRGPSCANQKPVHHLSIFSPHPALRPVDLLSQISLTSVYFFPWPLPPVRFRQVTIITYLYYFRDHPRFRLSASSMHCPVHSTVPGTAWHYSDDIALLLQNNLKDSYFPYDSIQTHSCHFPCQHL